MQDLSDLINQVKLDDDTENIQKILQLEKTILEEKKKKIALQKEKKMYLQRLLTTRLINQRNGTAEITHINNFEIIQCIGLGCNGAVFECNFHDNRTTSSNDIHKVALKMVLNSENKEKCKNEYSILWEIPDIHPNISVVYSEFIAIPTKQMLDFIKRTFDISKLINKQTQFYVMDLHPTSLDKQLKTNISMEQSKKYCIDIANSIHFLYQNHIAHLDIKSNNFLVSKNDDVILIDFGESVRLDSKYCLPFDVKLTRGNSNWRHPDVNKQINNKNNMISFEKQYTWELGCMVFKICFGQFPYSQPSLTGYERRPEFPSAITNYSDELKTLLTEALTINSDKFNISFDSFYKRLPSALEI